PTLSLHLSCARSRSPISTRDQGAKTLGSCGDVVGSPQGVNVPSRQPALVRDLRRTILSELRERALALLPFLERPIRRWLPFERNSQSQCIHHGCAGALAERRCHRMGRITDDCYLSRRPSDQLGGLISIVT